jgi:hypothetical protein
MAPYKNPVTVLLGQRVALGALRTVPVLGRSEYTSSLSMGRIRLRLRVGQLLYRIVEPDRYETAFGVVLPKLDLSS